MVHCLPASTTLSYPSHAHEIAFPLPFWIFLVFGGAKHEINTLKQYRSFWSRNLDAKSLRALLDFVATSLVLSSDTDLVNWSSSLAFASSTSYFWALGHLKLTSVAVGSNLESKQLAGFQTIHGDIWVAGTRPSSPSTGPMAAPRDKGELPVVLFEFMLENMIHFELPGPISDFDDFVKKSLG